MTYGLAMRLNAGMVFMSDTRTNAGVDSVATFLKCFVFDGAPDRILVILTAGNLAVTQATLGLLEQRLGSSDKTKSIYAAPSLYDVARILGQTLREVYELDATSLKNLGVDFNATFLVGGQIKNERMRLFHVYPAGNFIEATVETPYFQIGETKYGKPIIERVLNADTPLIEAAKCALVSFDSTIKGNISVAAPIDLVICPTGLLHATVRWRIYEDDPYWERVKILWGEGLSRLFHDLPDPDWADTGLDTIRHAATQKR